jgi:hypothetical protein
MLAQILLSLARVQEPWEHHSLHHPSKQVPKAAALPLVIIPPLWEEAFLVGLTKTSLGRAIRVSGNCPSGQDPCPRPRRLDLNSDSFSAKIGPERHNHGPPGTPSPSLRQELSKAPLLPHLCRSEHNLVPHRPLHLWLRKHEHF